jgi:tetratricopeptide (TPR) repeat protein
MAVGKGPPPKPPKVDLDDLVKRWEADKKSRLFLTLAEEYRRLDMVDAALSVLREGLKHHAAFAPAHVVLARCLVAKGQLSLAQAELEPIVKRSPDNLMAGKLLAQVLQDRGEATRALQVLRTLAPFAATDPEVGERMAALESRVQPARAAPVAPAAEAALPVEAETHETGEFLTGDFESPGGTSAALRSAAPPKLPSGLPFDFGGGPGSPGPVAQPIESPPSASGLELESEAGLDIEMATPLDVDLFGGDDLPPPPRPEPLDANLLAPRGEAAPAQDEFTSMTLAELYESQGALAQAAAIYERLLAARPEDAELRRAVARCRAAPSGEPAKVVERVAAPPAAPQAPRWAPVRPRAPAPVREEPRKLAPRDTAHAVRELRKLLAAARAVRMRQ